MSSGVLGVSKVSGFGFFWGGFRFRFRVVSGV